MRDNLNATMNGASKLQKMGLDLVNDLHMYIRSLQLYKADNQIFLRPLSRMEETINWVIAREGKMHLYGASSTLYLNEHMLRFRVATLANVNFLLEELSKRDIGGLLINKPITQLQLQGFLKQFSDESAKPKGGSDIQLEPLELVASRLQEVARVEMDQIESLKADPQQYAFLLYHRLYRFVNQYYVAENAQDVSTAQPIRILQEFIDLASRHDLDFLGLSDESDSSSYEIYHVCNVTISALLFGRYLGIPKLKLLDLGLMALRHNLGKQRMDSQILQKKTPLSTEEYNQLQKIPLISAKELLSGPFSWERLRHAIGIAHMQQPYVEPLQPGGSTELKGPWLFSRILRLCTCFDALCSQRPYRKKLQPAEALLFMQKSLEHTFDPFLLRKFLMMFGKVAVKALKQSSDTLETPKEERELPKHNVLYMGSGFESEVDEFWHLRQLPFRTEREEKRLEVLELQMEQMHAGEWDADWEEEGVKTFTMEHIPAAGHGRT